MVSMMALPGGGAARVGELGPAAGGARLVSTWPKEAMTLSSPPSATLATVAIHATLAFFTATHRLNSARIIFAALRSVVERIRGIIGKFVPVRLLILRRGTSGNRPYDAPCPMGSLTGRISNKKDF